jgi:3-oxoacyl-[acyl-carrier protein] reductase
MDLGISGRRVTITGASQGIGEAIAVAFAKEGCKVSVIARREEKLQELVNRIGGEDEGHAYSAVDLMEDGGPTRAIEELSEKVGMTDIIVHNVGGTLNVKDPLSPMEDWFRVARFNVGIPMEMNALVIPAMQEQKWGRVIHISSISAEALRGSAPYGAAKAYMNAYSVTLGRAMAPDNVIVSALMPGSIIAEGGHWDNIKKTNPQMMDDFLRHHHAIGRLGTAEEIAPFAVFMGSEYVTFAAASLINIDGGTM